MSPRGRRVTALLLLALAAACGSDGGPGSRDAEETPVADQASPDGVTDAEGRTVVLRGSPERIVSLVPSATATLRALGAEERLVGRTDFDTARALADLPSVGGGLQPSPEVLLSLSPDLVIRFAGRSDVDTPRLLDEAGVPHLAVRPERIEDVRRMIRTLGRVTESRARADSILALQERTLRAIRTRTEGLPPVRVAFTIGGDPPFVAGPETFVGELMAVAGGENVFSDLRRPWAGVSPETFVDRSPDLVLTPEGTELDARLTRGAEVRRVPALVQLPGPELHRAALAIARAIRPALFRGPDSPSATAPDSAGARRSARDSAGPGRSAP